MSDKLTADRLLFTTVADATLEQLTKLVTHVARLNPEQDHEEPELYLAWILEHGLRFNRLQSEFLSKLLLGYQLEKIKVVGPATARCHVHNLLSLARTIAPSTPPEGYLQPHQIYLAFDRENGAIVDIAGFVPDDRDVGKAEGLADKDPLWIGFFGGHNVNRAYRGRGIGPLMIAHRVDQIQSYVNQSGRPATVHTFLTNPVSGNLLVNFGGFEHIGRWHINFFDTDEEVFRRTFTPQ